MSWRDRWRIALVATNHGFSSVKPRRVGTCESSTCWTQRRVRSLSSQRTSSAKGSEGLAATPEVLKAKETMKKQNRFPPGWNNARVQRLLDHYEEQSDIEAVAEDEAAYRSTTTTVMKIPVKLVPAVRALLAKRRAS